jgi:hypothetical protein
VPTYTVFGFWPETHQRFCESYVAGSADEAESLCATFHLGIAIVATVEGYHLPTETSTKVTYT